MPFSFLDSFCLFRFFRFLFKNKSLQVLCRVKWNTFLQIFEQILFVYTKLGKNLHDEGICSVAHEGSSQMAQIACAYLVTGINGCNSLEQGDNLPSMEVSWSSFLQLREQGLGTWRVTALGSYWLQLMGLKVHPSLLLAIVFAHPSTVLHYSKSLWILKWFLKDPFDNQKFISVLNHPSLLCFNPFLSLSVFI